MIVMVALFVIMTILVCVGVDGVVQWRKSRRESAAWVFADGLIPAGAFESMLAPADVYLDDGHTWVRVAPSGRADVGLDGFAQSLIGRMDTVVLPEVGKEVRRGDMLFAVRQDNRRAAFASPVDGVVSSVDEDLPWHPEAISSDPYKYGWVCSVKPKNLAANLRRMRAAEDAKAWLKDEARRFQEFFAARPLEDMRLGQVLQDGGQITGGVLEFTDDKTWNQFNELFLRPRREGEGHAS